MRNSNIGNIIQVRIVSICFSFKFYKSKQLGKGTWYIYYHFSCLKNSSCQLSATSYKNCMNVKIMLLRKLIFSTFLDEHLFLYVSLASDPVRSSQQFCFSYFHGKAPGFVSWNGWRKCQMALLRWGRGDNNPRCETSPSHLHPGWLACWLSFKTDSSAPCDGEEGEKWV